MAKKMTNKLVPIGRNSVLPNKKTAVGAGSKAQQAYAAPKPTGIKVTQQSTAVPKPASSRSVLPAAKKAVGPGSKAPAMRSTRQSVAAPKPQTATISNKKKR